MDPDDFDAASAVTRLDDTRFRCAVPAGWRQGASVYGGLGGAILLRAMQAAAGDRPARTVTVQFCAPVPEGDHDVEVTIERRGSTTAFASARLRVGDRVALHAMATFGSDRTPRLDIDSPRIPEGVPEAQACVVAPMPSPPFPQFLQHYEVRIAVGGLPAGASRTGESRIGAWIRPRRPVPLTPHLALALLDAMPPVALTRSTTPGGMASVSLHAQLVAPLPDPGLAGGRALGSPCYVEVWSSATQQGFSDQSGRLYGPDGRLVAVVSQLFAVM